MKKHEPMTEERLFEIKARAKAATPGPWYHVLAAIVGTTPRPDDDNTTCICNTEWGNSTNIQPNAEFIAAAREDVPALLAEVERLRTDVARLRARLRWISKCAFKDTNRCAKLPGFSRCVWNCGEWCGAADDLRKGCWRDVAGMATRENPGESG